MKPPAEILRRALAADVKRLVTMMEEFYAEAAYPLNRQRAAEAFARLLADERLGRVWFIQASVRLEISNDCSDVIGLRASRLANDRQPVVSVRGAEGVRAAPADACRCGRPQFPALARIEPLDSECPVAAGKIQLRRAAFG